MAKEPELKARDKVVMRMTREGAVEENLTAGTEQRVSKRLEDAELVKPAETAKPSEALSAEEQKKVQMRRQQRQFQAEHAEDNDTQPPSETSVTEKKRAENPPQNVPEPLPSSETPFKPPVLEQHGVSSHTGTVIAETIVTHIHQLFLLAAAFLRLWKTRLLKERSFFMNPKYQKVLSDIEKAEKKKSEIEGQLKELYDKKTELENLEIINTVRSMVMDKDQIMAFLSSMKGGTKSAGNTEVIDNA